MSLVIGIEAFDGVVLLADSGAAIGDAFDTVRVSRVVKLHSIKDRLIIGLSGESAIGLRYAHALRNTDDLPDAMLSSVVAADRVSAAILVEARRAYDGLVKAAPLATTPLRNFVYDHVAEALVACVSNESPTLLRITQQGQCHPVDPGIYFHAVGSMQPMALTHLAYTKRLLWGDRQPKVSEAIFSALWAFDFATGGFPDHGHLWQPHVAVLRYDGTSSTARVLDENELIDSYEAIGDMRKQIAAIARGLEPGAPARVPVPPKQKSR